MRRLFVNIIKKEFIISDGSLSQATIDSLLENSMFSNQVLRYDAKDFKMECNLTFPSLKKINNEAALEIKEAFTNFFEFLHHLKKEQEIIKEEHKRIMSLLELTKLYE